MRLLLFCAFRQAAQPPHEEKAAAAAAGRDQDTKSNVLFPFALGTGEANGSESSARGRDPAAAELSRCRARRRTQLTRGEERGGETHSPVPRPDRANKARAGERGENRRSRYSWPKEPPKLQR